MAFEIFQILHQQSYIINEQPPFPVFSSLYTGSGKNHPPACENDSRSGTMGSGSMGNTYFGQYFSHRVLSRPGGFATLNNTRDEKLLSHKGMVVLQGTWPGIARRRKSRLKQREDEMEYSFTSRYY